MDQSKFIPKFNSEFVARLEIVSIQCVCLCACLKMYRSVRDIPPNKLTVVIATNVGSRKY